jgi:hypothetical protein
MKQGILYHLHANEGTALQVKSQVETQADTALNTVVALAS